MSVLDKVVERKERMGRLEMHIPEWGVTLFFPPFTGHEHRHLSIKAETELADVAAKFICDRAELEDGTKAFQRGDRMKLVRAAEYHVLKRVVDDAWDWTPDDLNPETSSQAQDST